MNSAHNGQIESIAPICIGDAFAFCVGSPLCKYEGGDKLQQSYQDTARLDERNTCWQHHYPFSLLTKMGRGGGLWFGKAAL